MNKAKVIFLIILCFIFTDKTYAKDNVVNPSMSTKDIQSIIDNNNEIEFEPGTYNKIFTITITSNKTLFSTGSVEFIGNKNIGINILNNSNIYFNKGEFIFTDYTIGINMMANGNSSINVDNSTLKIENSITTEGPATGNGINIGGTGDKELNINNNSNFISSNNAHAGIESLAVKGRVYLNFNSANYIELSNNGLNAKSGSGYHAGDETNIYTEIHFNNVTNAHIDNNYVDGICVNKSNEYGSSYIYIKNTNITINNNGSWGTNGGHIRIIDSNLDINNNSNNPWTKVSATASNLYAFSLYVDNSNLNANNSGVYSGIWVSGDTLINNSNLNSNNNGWLKVNGYENSEENIYSGGYGLYTYGSLNINNSTINLNNNSGSGLFSIAYNINKGTDNYINNEAYSQIISNSNINSSSNSWVGLYFLDKSGVYKGAYATITNNSNISSDNNCLAGIRFGSGATIDNSTITTSNNGQSIDPNTNKSFRGINNTNWYYKSASSKDNFTYKGGVIIEKTLNINNSFISSTDNSNDDYFLSSWIYYNDNAKSIIDNTTIARILSTNLNTHGTLNSQRNYVINGSLNAKRTNMVGIDNYQLNSQVDDKIYTAPINKYNTMLNLFIIKNNNDSNSITKYDDYYKFTTYDPNTIDENNNYTMYEYKYKYDELSAYIWTPVTIIRYDTTGIIDGNNIILGSINTTNSTSTKGNVELTNVDDSTNLKNITTGYDYIEATDYTISGNTLDIAGKTLPSSSIEGYNFVGWYYVPDSKASLAASLSKELSFDKLQQLLEKYGTEFTESTMTSIFASDISTVNVYAKWSQGTIKIHYIKKSTNEELLDIETLTGKIDSDYITNYKDISGYTYLSCSSNTKGKFTKDNIDIYYYYDINESVEQLPPQTGIDIFNNDKYSTLLSTINIFVLIALSIIKKVRHV